MKKTVNIISRSSTLAKIQAEMVGSVILNKHPQISLNYILTKTSGDVNQNIDISKSTRSMPRVYFVFGRNVPKTVFFVRNVLGNSLRCRVFVKNLVDGCR